MFNIERVMQWMTAINLAAGLALVTWLSLAVPAERVAQGATDRAASTHPGASARTPAGEASR